MASPKKILTPASMQSGSKNFALMSRLNRKWHLS